MTLTMTPAYRTVVRLNTGTTVVVGSPTGYDIADDVHAALYDGGLADAVVTVDLDAMTATITDAGDLTPIGTATITALRVTPSIVGGGW
ncbi:hypothetical protein AB0B94_30405 [Micromonospora sp. NPDC048986]|uniref:hypothetical protein n=1 Tax=Micromonospora sp. NPDC048986 TaxID=3155644 RepID=UPI0033CF4047